MIFTANKNNIANQNGSTLGTDLVESLKSLFSVTEAVLREENQNNVHKSNGD